jgi:hypothetical protein
MILIIISLVKRLEFIKRLDTYYARVVTFLEIVYFSATTGTAFRLFHTLSTLDIINRYYFLLHAVHKPGDVAFILTGWT